jgi:hypothetical protein
MVRLCKQGVTGSIPVTSTTFLAKTEICGATSGNDRPRVSPPCHRELACISAIAQPVVVQFIEITDGRRVELQRFHSVVLHQTGEFGFPICACHRA